MSEAKKRNIITVVIVTLAVILVLLAVLSLTLKTFVVDAILHTYLRLLFVPLIIIVLQKCFRDQLPHHTEQKSPSDKICPSRNGAEAP